MGQARTNRRRRKQMAMNNAQWSGIGVSRYGGRIDYAARARRDERRKQKQAATGSVFATGGGKK